MNLWFLSGGKFDKELEKIEHMFPDYQMNSDYQIKVVNCEDLTFVIENNLPAKLWLNYERVDPPDAFLIMDMSNPLMFSIAKQLENLGSFPVNPVNKRLFSLKVTTYEILARAGLPVPKTIIFKNNIKKEFLIDELGLPMVVKPEDGYGGSDVKLIKTGKDLENTIKQIKDSSSVILVQKYIESSKGKDLRVQTIGYEAIFSVIRRASDSNEFRSNVKLGGSLEEVELTEEIKILSNKIAKAMGLKLLGIDFLFTENGFVVTEVNTMPGSSLPQTQKKYISSLIKYLKSELIKQETPHWRKI
jgi:ribosomal protein S6--L-glutamate ligase/gamma-F420-2:alpha-L-glutamate ligase